MKRFWAGFALPLSLSAVLSACVSDAQLTLSSTAATKLSASASSSSTPAVFSLTSVSPIGGPLAGGTTVTLTGALFNPAATVTIGGLPCSPVTYVSSTSVTCPSPGNSAGTYPVVITNPGPVNSGSVNYTYSNAPTVSNTTPWNGSSTGGTPVVVTGTNFIAGASVTIGGANCTSVNVTSPTSISCIAPAGTMNTYGTVVVTNPDTQFGNLASYYYFNLTFNLTEVSPTSMAANGSGNIMLSLSGSNVISPTFTVGGSPCTAPTFVSSFGFNPTSYTYSCTAPALTAGTYSIVATSNDGQTSTLTNAMNVVGTADSTQSQIIASASLVPSDGIAKSLIYVVPRASSGAPIGPGVDVEVNTSNSNVTFTGGTSCRVVTATCTTASYIGGGTYIAQAVSSIGATSTTFSAVLAMSSDINVTATANVTFNSAVFTTYSSNTTITSAQAAQNMYITGGTITFDNTTVGLTFGHIIARGGTITHLTTTVGTAYALNFNVNSLVLQGGIIDVSGKGYTTGYSFGSAAPSTSLASSGHAGASHGGSGGRAFAEAYSTATSGAPYDDLKNPMYPGAGVNGGAGGGVVKITSAGPCVITSPSWIYARGGIAGAAGGTINLNCSVFAGSPSISSISAQGMSASTTPDISGGGGGRIALVSTGSKNTFIGGFYYPNSKSTRSALLNIVDARGGSYVYNSTATGWNGGGGAGTIYLKHSGISSGDLILRNNGGYSFPVGDSYTNLVTTSANANVLYSAPGGTGVATVTNAGSPFTGMTNLFTGALLHIFTTVSPISPLDGSHSAMPITANATNTFTSSSNFPSIASNYYYRVVLQLDHIEVVDGATLNMGGADMLLTSGCDMHSANTAQLEIEASLTASIIGGNSIGAQVCTNALLKTAGTVSFANYFLQ